MDAAAELRVLQPPRLTRRPRAAVSARAQGDAALRCAARGRPRPRLQWYKNGELLVESQYFRLSSERGPGSADLHILGLVELDSGVYQCVASNEVGNVQAEARLVVKPKGEEHSTYFPGC